MLIFVVLQELQFPCLSGFALSTKFVVLHPTDSEAVIRNLHSDNPGCLELGKLQAYSLLAC